VTDGEVDGRSDLYSLGCVVYWILTGQLVFEATSPLEMMIKHSRDRPIPPSERSEIEVLQGLDRLVLRCPLQGRAVLLQSRLVLFGPI